MLQPDWQVLPADGSQASVESHDAPKTPVQHGSLVAPHASHVPPPDGHTSEPPLHEAPAATHVVLEGSQQPPFVHPLPGQHASPVAPHAVQVVPDAHATPLQHDPAQSAAVSALSPAGTQPTHVPWVVSQRSELWHSELAVHDDAQVVEVAQPRPFGQVEAPPPHVPAPLHVPGDVSTPSLHERDPHAVPLPGYTHAPDVSQSVAPQVPPVVQAPAQQCVPLPAGPQMSVAHWAFDVHDVPAPQP
jgi:hypothetical protein